MTTQHLGTQPTSAGIVHVFVVWVDFPDRALGVQLLHPTPCPQCGGPLTIGPRFNDAAIASIAVTCPTCSAQTHFDRTPVAERPHLRWVLGFRRE
jgi:endogenous inhibitor of DNA gyrase (YacG/DUF329 family)